VALRAGAAISAQRTADPGDERDTAGAGARSDENRAEPARLHAGHHHHDRPREHPEGARELAGGDPNSAPSIFSAPAAKGVWGWRSAVTICRSINIGNG
jgi:hypothetical protein